jgi:hypothetical protein
MTPPPATTVLEPSVSVAAGNLVIKDVEKTDGGDYVCVAENMAGVKQSDVATLSVHGRCTYITAVLLR